MKRVSALCLPSFMGLYLLLALPGLRYGLTDQTHFYSYNCDEIMWIIGAKHATQTPGRIQ